MWVTKLTLGLQKISSPFFCHLKHSFFFNYTNLKFYWVLNEGTRDSFLSSNSELILYAQLKIDPWVGMHVRNPIWSRLHLKLHYFNEVNGPLHGNIKDKRELFLFYIDKKALNEKVPEECSRKSSPSSLNLIPAHPSIKIICCLQNSYLFEELFLPAKLLALSFTRSHRIGEQPWFWFTLLSTYCWETSA